MVSANNDLPSWSKELLRLLSITCPFLKAEVIRVNPIQKKLIVLKASRQEDFF